jgi:hypothetical protein
MESRLDGDPLKVHSSGMAMSALGKQLMTLGGTLLVIGAVLYYGSPSRGGLPGDIVIERPGFSFHFPVVTCLVLSLIFSGVLRWLNR